MAHRSWKCRDARSRVRLGASDAMREASGWTPNALSSLPGRHRSTRWLLLAAVLATLVLPSYAAEKLTVSELEQILAQHAAQPHESAKKHSAASSDEIPDMLDGDMLQQLDQDDELL